MRSASPQSWPEMLLADEKTGELASRLQAGQEVAVRGLAGSSGHLLASLLARKLGRCILLAVAHLDEAEDAYEDARLLDARLGPIPLMRFPALEQLPGETGISLELVGERLAMVDQLTRAPREAQPRLVIASISALMQSVPCPQDLGSFQFQIARDQPLQPGALIDWLDRAGYQRTEAIEQPGDFAMRGGIIDIFVPSTQVDEDDPTTSAPLPIRLDFFGDEVESIRIIDTQTMGSGRQLDQIRIIGASAGALQSDARTVNLIDLLPSDHISLLLEPMELAEQGRGYYERLVDPRGIYPPAAVLQKLTRGAHAQVSGMIIGTNTQPLTLPVRPLEPFDQDRTGTIHELVQRAQQARLVVLCGKPAEESRLGELIDEHHPDVDPRPAIEPGELHRGFVWGDLHLVSNAEIFHRYQNRRRVRRLGTVGLPTPDRPMDVFFDLEPGDAVVHIDHGVAIFKGLRTLRRKGEAHEVLTLEFHGGALLHVPVSNIEQVQKYVGGMHATPPLSVLGGRRWSRQKQEAAHAARDLARQMLQIQAARNAMPGISYPADTRWQREFEAAFPYEETEDQLAALAEIKKNMADPRPMDRLICGDVGFGKTELAIRAAFKAVESGRQVAVLVPTTVLAEQHERTFNERMAEYPFRIESVSRFKTGSEQDQILAELAAGRVDIIIGTHRLLSGDVKFADLGLVVIDEEQRFGVEHKNRLFQFRLTADVLTLSATPIPRTLHMSMLRLRDISSLATPPADRRAVVTEVMAYNGDHIQQAIRRELARDGQVFFVHNRIHNIQRIADRIQALVPEARIVIGHGQMPSRELEAVMLKFMRHEADVLVSTTIIESGIDIPTANTMFIHEADHFGLADLHQLRGRVGRYRNRAYCYLLLPEDRPVTDSARKRLRAIEQFAMLGAGFKIAMRDLEIRGAGNLLGKEQSGHIAAVGYQMYCMLLEREAGKLRNEEALEPPSSHLELGITAVLDKAWIRSDKFRMDAYRRLGRAATLTDLDQVINALIEAYGEPSPVAQLYIDLVELRVATAIHRIDSLKRDQQDLIFTTAQPRELEPLFAHAPGRTSLIDQHTVYWRPPPAYMDNTSTMLAVLRKLLVRPLRDRDGPRDATTPARAADGQERSTPATANEASATSRLAEIRRGRKADAPSQPNAAPPP
ncbi:MAG: transcription-repair coupling factor [Phycisphaeraceae bacterium]|nr:transcription-repair coupling factor [Phycisphaeraceae bacterium]